MRWLNACLLLLFFCLIGFDAKAQTNPLFYDYSYNHLKWFNLESEHFNVIFQEGNSRSAQVISRIAEEVHPAITELYQYEPDTKVSIVIKDREDYSNGAAYFFDNKIDIWLPALDTPLRGTHNWLRNVIAHEYTHIIQIQASMKRSRKVPALYFQWLTYEEVRRPDVLFGYPNGIVTLPFATVNVPAWFAEGTAQYQRAGLDYDTWDSHRDMILRTRILNDSYLSLDQMKTFANKTSIEREVVYNQGYAFTKYLAERFGEGVLRDISEALGQKGVYSIAKAIEIATEIPGRQVFEEWIEAERNTYEAAISTINPTDSEYVEEDGFFNFTATKSPDGTYTAYLSNKGRDGSLLSLYLKKGEETEAVAILEEEVAFSQHEHHMHFEEPTVRIVTGGYTFSPGSDKIAYVKIRRNNFAELYNDIYIYDIATSKHKRITSSSRISMPVWSADENILYARQLEAGTYNLISLNIETGEITRLTDYSHGESVYSPVLNNAGDAIYFAFSDHGDRSIARYNLNTNEIDFEINSPTSDVRDPMLSKDDQFIYYSTNPDGIFNIFRMDLSTNESEQLTNVIGGAFMPFITDEGELLYSEYEAPGYKIKKTQIEAASSGSYDISKRDFGYQFPVSESVLALNKFDDSDLLPLPESVMALADTGSTSFNFNNRFGVQETKIGRYDDVFTSFSILPAVRFDNYSRLNGSNGSLIKNAQFGDLGDNLIRDFKAGFYVSSRDVTDRLSLFGGILLGIGSEPADGIGDAISPDRLINLDRDIFLIAEQRGLPFIKAGWSPTVAIEIYNLHRNVRDGLTIEEFPCTACLPENSFTDISYEIWEADLFLRSKIDRRSLVEVGIGFSPYRVNTDDFFSKELNQFVPGSTAEYFRATTLSASYTFDYYRPGRNRDIAPIGLRGYVRYQYQPSRLLDQFEVEDGTLVPVYDNFRNHSVEVHGRYGKQVFDNSTLQFRGRGFTYLQNPSNFFFLDYIGGLTGMRSYPFFAIGGNRTAHSSISLMTPIWNNINKQAGPYTFDKVFARVFLEAGNGWSGPLDIGNELKTGIGAELRFSFTGYYIFPLRFFVSGAYGFNRFNVTLPDEFITGSQSNRVDYGRELLFHFGLTFDFEFL